MSRSAGWTCSRQAAGVKCAHRNPARKRLCVACGKPRPVRRKPAHMAALDLSYEQYIALNACGEACGICGRTRSELPNPGRRLDRDHDHKTGKPRGLLCRECNRRLKHYLTPMWLRKATYYLERP